MAIVLDELVVILGLDASKFNDAQRAAMEAFKKTQEAAAKGGKDIESQSKKTLEFFVNLKREALGLLAVFYGGRGFGEIVHHITSLDSSTERLSRTFGVSTHDLALWQIVLQQVGGSVEDARSAIGGLASALAEFQVTGVPNTGLLSLLTKLHLPANTSDPTKILTALSALSQEPEMRADPRRFAVWANMVPGMNQGMINALIEGPAKLKEMLDAAEKAGAATKETGLASERFIKSLALLETASTNVARVMLDYLVPAMDALTTLLPKWLVTPGSSEAKTIDKKFTQDVEKHFGNSRALIELLMGPRTAAEIYDGPQPDRRPRRRGGGGGIEVLETATGFEVTENGVVIAGGALSGGAKSAAAARSTHNRWHHQSSNWSSNTKIDTINVNVPNARDARGIASGIKDAIGSESLGAPLNSAY